MSSNAKKWAGSKQKATNLLLPSHPRIMSLIFLHELWKVPNINERLGGKKHIGHKVSWKDNPSFRSVFVRMAEARFTHDYINSRNLLATLFWVKNIICKPTHLQINVRTESVCVLGAIPQSDFLSLSSTALPKRRSTTLSRGGRSGKSGGPSDHLSAFTRTPASSEEKRLSPGGLVESPTNCRGNRLGFKELDQHMEHKLTLRANWY